MIRLSGKSIDQIFGQFDVDGGGDISAEEFRQAMKEISMTMTDIEINKIMQRVDADGDGNISYQEFTNKFRDDPEFDRRMRMRANNRLALLKQ